MREVRVVPIAPRWALAALAAVVAVLCVQLVSAGPVSAAEWSSQASGTGSDLRAVSCPSDLHCFAVGAFGTIRATSDGGRTWESRDSGAGTWYGVSCASPATCVTVGAGGSTASTSNGGATWTERASGQSQNLYGVSCPTAATCFAVGAGGRIVRTIDGGETWTSQTSGTTRELGAVSCPTVNVCYAVGETDGVNGTIRTTKNGGVTAWTGQTSPTPWLHLWGVSCANATHCWAVGLYKTVATTNGVTWTSQQTGGSTTTLDAISCPTDTSCVAGGGSGALLSTNTGGLTAWVEEDAGTTETLYGVSCPDPADCWAVGSNGAIITNSQAAQTELPDPDLAGVPSNDCEIAPATAVIDGYFGTLYARSKVKSADGETWMCARLQEEGEQEIVGGKFVVADATSTVGQDEFYSECSTAAGNLVPGGHPVTSGAIGQPGDPHYTPFLLDAYANSDGDAWVCLRAGLGVRLKFSGAAPAFEQDDPQDPAAVSPPRTPWPVGKASSACETQVGGTVGRHVNALIAGAHAWVSSRTEGSKAELCFRAQGDESVGGRVTVDTSGSVGVTPVIEPAFDTTGCTRTELSEEPHQLYIRRSETGTNPASVCVSLGGSTVRFTVGYTGTPTAPEIVDWELDND